MATEQINDGGPAYPVPPGGCSWTTPDGYTVNQFPGHCGMSLRDYFAGQTLVGTLAAEFEGEGGVGAWTSEKHLADYCYKVADAMIAARNNKPEVYPNDFP